MSSSYSSETKKTKARKSRRINARKAKTTKRSFKFSNGWTPELEISCKKIGSEAARFKWLHKRNAMDIDSKLENTTMAAAILTTMATASSLIDFLVKTYANVEWVEPLVKFCTIIFTLIAAGLMIGQKTYNFVGKIQNHRKSEGRYKWLFFNIQAQLQLPISARQEGKAYFNWVSHEANAISNIEDIDDKVIKSYYKNFPDDNIPGFDELDEIEINDHEESGSLTVDETIEPSPSGDSGFFDKLGKKKERDIDKSDIRKFRAERDLGVMQIVSHVNCPTPDSKRRPKVEEIQRLKYEMDRFQKQDSDENRSSDDVKMQRTNSPRKHKSRRRASIDDMV